MAKCCVVFSQSPSEDLTAFRVRHVLLLVSILTRVTRRDSDGYFRVEFVPNINSVHLNVYNDEIIKRIQSLQ